MTPSSRTRRLSRERDPGSSRWSDGLAAASRTMGARVAASASDATTSTNSAMHPSSPPRELRRKELAEAASGRRDRSAAGPRAPLDRCCSTPAPDASPSGSPSSGSGACELGNGATARGFGMARQGSRGALGVTDRGRAVQLRAGNPFHRWTGTAESRRPLSRSNSARTIAAADETVAGSARAGGRPQADRRPNRTARRSSPARRGRGRGGGARRRGSRAPVSRQRRRGGSPRGGPPRPRARRAPRSRRSPVLLPTRARLDRRPRGVSAGAAASRPRRPARRARRSGTRAPWPRGR